MECGRDHKLLIIELEFPRYTFKTIIQLKQKSLKIQDLYKKRLYQKRQEFNYETIAEMYEHIEECVNQVALKALGKEGTKIKNQKDLTEETSLVTKQH